MQPYASVDKVVLVYQRRVRFIRLLVVHRGALVNNKILFFSIILMLDGQDADKGTTKGKEEICENRGSLLL